MTGNEKADYAGMVAQDPISFPNDSMARMLVAIGVFAAPERTLTNPIAAHVDRFNPMSALIVLLAVAPTQMRGSIIPHSRRNRKQYSYRGFSAETNPEQSYPPARAQ